MIGTFFLIYWLQSMDKNFNKKNKFDKYKIPVISSALIGLISHYVCESNSISDIIGSNSSKSQEIFTEVPDF